MMFRISVDAGVTFTDFPTYNDGTGALYTGKVLATTSESTLGIMKSLNHLLAKPGLPSEIFWNTTIFNGKTLAIKKERKHRFIGSYL
jgi:N-methylhydantoinase A/oxoprolinase/acetone carboxylase beta subunit